MVSRSISVRETLNNQSRLSDIDDEVRSKFGADSRRIFSRGTSFRRELTANLKKADGSEKISQYPFANNDRNGWWRVNLRDTPNPGAYETHLNTFVKELVARPMTYGFKNDGRRRDPQPLEPKGKELLPGAYQYSDFATLTRQLRLNYGFRGPEREELLQKSASAHRDKDIDIAPGLYETQNYQRIHAAREPIRHSMFRSRTPRLAHPKNSGPAPGDYETQMTTIDLTSPSITSSFRSSSARFSSRSSKVPGPGTYEKLINAPKLEQIDLYSAHGIYFDIKLVEKKSTLF